MNEGLKHKYNITKADGRPVDGLYFVLKLDSKDKAHGNASRMAALTYAEEIAPTNPKLAGDLREVVKKLEMIAGAASS